MQFDAGFRNNKLEADLDWSGLIEASAEQTAGAFTIGLTNYNLFDIIPVLSVGFMDSFTGYFGDIKGFDFLIGPAIGVNVCDVVKFQCAFGLSLGVAKEGDSDDTDGEYSSGGVGFGVDVQAKFIPAKRASPLMGFRYKMNNLSDDGDVVAVTLKSVAIYFGVGINFGI